MRKKPETELTLEDFTSKVKGIVAEAEDFRKNPRKIVSDVIDNDNNQYVDLVQEGGGVLGIALVGYTYILEKAGIRFFSLAGTSAGAINTLLLASLREDTKTRSERILEYLVKKDLFEIVDGDKSIKKFIQSYLDGNVRWLSGKTLFLIIKALLILFCRLGINPGKDFEEWIRQILKDNGIEDTKDLLKVHNEIPELKPRKGVNMDNLRKRLVMVSSDITTQTKVHFPEMAKLYWEDENTINPSKYLRASMSIPLFFKPFKVKNIPNNDEAKKMWFNEVRFKGKTIPGTVRFVDGGLLSNFPINAFHNIKVEPRMPTFGVRLSAYRATHNRTNRLIPFIWAMVKTMRQLYDTDFLLKHDDYRQLICRLDTDNKFNWLDFNMSNTEKLDLFEMGADGAMDFLNRFDWKDYKATRKRLHNIS